MALNKETLLKRGKIEEVALPDGETVYLKELPASFFIGSGKKQKEEQETDGAAQIAASLCDEKGALLFDIAKDRQDILGIGLSDFGFLVRKIAEVNGLASSETKATEAEKN